MDQQSQQFNNTIPTYQVQQHNALQLEPCQEQQDQFMVEKFMNMCATIIQKFYRGHLMRKKHYFVVNQIQKFHDALWAVVLGWRIRKIIKLKRMQDITQEMKTLIWKRRELILSIRQNMPKIPKDYDSQFMRKKEKEALKVAMQNNQQYKFMSNELEPLQKEFITTINRLMVTGLWIYEDKHYKKNVQTIVTSFTIIDQSKHFNKEPLHPSTQFNRSQFVTPTQSQYLSPPGSNLQQKMVYTTPIQQQQQHRVAFNPQQSNYAAPNNVSSQFNYPEIGNVQSIYYDQNNQLQDQSKDASVVQFGSARNVQLERKLNYNQQSQENIIQSKKSSEQIELNQLEQEQKTQNQQNQQQQSQNNIQNTNDKPMNMKGALLKQQCRDMDQEANEIKNNEDNQQNDINNEQNQQQEQQQQQEKAKGFSWDDVPVGQARKKFQFEEFPEQVITTDIKPTIPKKKLQKLKEQNGLQEENKSKDPSRKQSEEIIIQQDEKKEAVKKSAKGKTQKKQQQEEKSEEQVGNNKSRQLRSQTEFPLVYQGDLDTGTHKTKSKNSKVPLTQEEKEEKERQEKLEKIKNLKKRMKYDPRKAIQNGKNGVKDKKEEEDENYQTEENRVNSDDSDEDEDQVSSKDVDFKNRSKSTHVMSKKEKENDKNSDKQTDKGSFLKRQSKNMASQKLNWKKTESRVDCWSSWNKRSKNYIQNSQTNFINNTPTKRKITLSSHNQQSARSNGNNEFSFAQNKLHSVSEAQQFQQKVRNKFGLNGQSNANLPSDKNILSPQQSMTMIKQSNWLHSTIDPNQKDLMSGKESGPSMASFMKLPNLDLNSLQNISTGDLLKLREALIPIIQTNLIFIEQNDSKIFTKIAKEILKSSNSN